MSTKILPLAATVLFACSAAKPEPTAQRTAHLDGQSYVLDSFQTFVPGCLGASGGLDVGGVALGGPVGCAYGALPGNVQFGLGSAVGSDDAHADFEFGGSTAPSLTIADDGSVSAAYFRPEEESPAPLPEKKPAGEGCFGDDECESGRCSATLLQCSPEACDRPDTGVCTCGQHADLEETKKNACNGLPSCNPQLDSCETLEAKRAAFEACYFARLDVVDTCFLGRPDVGHAIQLDEVSNAEQKCSDALARRCT